MCLLPLPRPHRACPRSPLHPGWTRVHTSRCLARLHRQPQHPRLVRRLRDPSLCSGKRPHQQRLLRLALLQRRGERAFPSLSLARSPLSLKQARCLVHPLRSHRQPHQQHRAKPPSPSLAEWHLQHRLRQGRASLCLVRSPHNKPHCLGVHLPQQQHRQRGRASLCLARNPRSSPRCLGVRVTL